MKSKPFILTILVFCALCDLRAQHENHAGSSSPTNERFNSIKSLAGDWEGSFEWIGTNRKGPMNAHYYLTGNGSAVVEDLITDGTPSMTTIYHLDGADLRATHYCAAGNQPRLKAASTVGDGNSLKFQMIDITNLSNPEAGHVKNLELRWTTPDRLTILFTFVGGAKESIEKIELVRKP
ncbi:MAG: hypothetical protein ACJ8M1_15590 [Chthoniobacterales bacterium]